MIEQLCAELAASQEEVESLTEQVAHRDERLLEAWEAIGGQRDHMSLADAILRDDAAAGEALGEDGAGQSLPERIGEMVDSYSVALAEAADALRAYLVSRDLPANPVRLEDPHLEALAQALL